MKGEDILISGTEKSKTNYEIKEKHQKHDKIIRDILNDKEEVVKIINKYIKPKEKLKKEEIEKYETSYITKNFQNKEADIVIVAGKKEFIDKINSLAINFHTKFTLVNCYEIDDFNKNLEDILKNYDKILCTKGIREIKELYLV